jgi:hypothetical protein
MQIGVSRSGLMDSTPLAEIMPAARAKDAAHTVMRIV